MIKKIKNIFSREFSPEQLEHFGKNYYSSFFEDFTQEEEVPELILQAREKYKDHTLSEVMVDFIELKNRLFLSGILRHGSHIKDEVQLLKDLEAQLLTMEAYSIYHSMGNKKRMIVFPLIVQMFRAIVLLGEVELLLKTRKMIFFIPNTDQKVKESFVIEEGGIEFINEMLKLIHDEGKTELSLLVYTIKGLDSTYIESVANLLVEVNRLTFSIPFYYEIVPEAPGNKLLFGS